MAVCVMPLVCKPVGAASAKVVALADAGAELPTLFLARACRSLYAVFAVKPLKVYVATSPTSVQLLSAPPLTS